MGAVNNLLSHFSGHDAWVYQVFIIVFLTLIVNYVVVKVLKKVEEKAKQTSNIWDDALIVAAGKPAGYLILVVGLAFALDILRGVSTDQAIFDFVTPARKVAVIFLFCWFLVRFIRRVERSLLRPNKGREPVDETTAHAISKLLRLAVIITGVLVALQSLGFSISGVLAFGGIGGIAVGFAAKDLLANFFGGLMIYLDRPFKVGDWIRSPDKSIEGTVEYIGWRQTRIRTFDRRPLYVPNATFASISVENPSRMQNRRIKEIIGLRYQDSHKVAEVLAEIKTYLEQHPEITTERTLMVNFVCFGPSSLDFMVYCFTKTTNWVKYQDVKQDVLLGILSIIHRHEADIAFPTTTLDLPESLPVNP